MTPRIPTIVMYGLCRWDYITNRPQNLAHRLSRYADVIYIDPPIGAGEQLPRIGEVLKHLVAPVLERRRVDEHIEVIGTRWKFPFPGKSALIRRVNTRLLGRRLRELSRGLVPAPVFWVMYPVDHHLLEYVERTLLVYDLVDRHAHFSGQSVDRITGIEASEQWLFEHADAVSVTARSLGDYAAEHGARNVTSIPNGCDFEHLSALAETTPRATDTPVVGFVGALGEWIDFDAIARVASELPNARVLLAGPFHPPLTCLPQGLPANIEHVGVVAYEALPAFLAKLDLTLVPFDVSVLTEAVNPVKVYEYLAAGKPVLATPLPELKGFSSVVCLREASEFGEAARELLASDSEALIAQRLDVAKNNSWTVRAQTAIEMIRSLLDLEGDSG